MLLGWRPSLVGWRMLEAILVSNFTEAQERTSLLDRALHGHLRGGRSSAFIRTLPCFHRRSGRSEAKRTIVFGSLWGVIGSPVFGGRQCFCCAASKAYIHMLIPYYTTPAIDLCLVSWKSLIDGRGTGAMVAPRLATTDLRFLKTKVAIKTPKVTPSNDIFHDPSCANDVITLNRSVCRHHHTCPRRKFCHPCTFNPF